MPPDIDHELVRVYGLLALAQTFGDTASLQDAEDEERAPAEGPEERAPASPNPAIQHRSRLPGLSERTEQSGLPEFGGGALTGELDLDFFGGQQPSSGGRTFPLLRIRRAFAELAWSRFALLVGQESPPIAEVSPSSLASIGFPGFAGAGNLWLWIPQLRLTADITSFGGLRLGAEIAALAPTSGEPQGAFLTQPDLAERSERPYLQGRLRSGWGEGDEPGEASFGGHYGWLVDGAGQRVPSRALAASLWTPIAGVVDLRAEAFTGQALAASNSTFARQRGWSSAAGLGSMIPTTRISMRPPGSVTRPWRDTLPGATPRRSWVSKYAAYEPSTRRRQAPVPPPTSTSRPDSSSNQWGGRAAGQRGTSSCSGRLRCL